MLKTERHSGGRSLTESSREQNVKSHMNVFLFCPYNIYCPERFDRNPFGTSGKTDESKICSRGGTYGHVGKPAGI